ncbi:hypothetical protein F0L68_35900 [Solihabitans fulvus]|uniref:Uncharacterized protein n=1 Tax=Solihabitans fulvus TaxID=1892852 RepID=A0A5B2WR26_9PSEU|nr:hypothetical protein [Solihabitans fulvus]KAA2252427.1 hypothetical protein F0L68_35900 [Solihabitans fulvus]
MSTIRRIVLGLFTVIAACGLWAAPASAQPAVHHAEVVRPADWQDTSCAYPGIFRDNSRVMHVTWPGDSNVECFGIAPNRTIWHAWNGSGGWVEMPGGGRADDTWDAWQDTNGNRTVKMQVNGAGFWCSTYPAGGNWGSWYHCSID